MLIPSITTCRPSGLARGLVLKWRRANQSKSTARASSERATPRTVWSAKRLASTSRELLSWKDIKLISDSYMNNHHASPNYDHHHAGSTALLMQAKPRQAPAVDSRQHSLDHYEDQLSRIERQDGTYQQNSASVYSRERGSPQQPFGQQTSRIDSYEQQPADHYAVQQYQRMLLREQAIRNRELERKS